MKISEMTNEQAADAMVKIAPAIQNLLNDENTKPMLEKLANAKGMDTVQIVATILPQAVAFCMKDHKDDLFAIVGALTMQPVSKVGKMNFVSTVKELRESFDEDFLGFFNSSGNQTKNAES